MRSSVSPTRLRDEIDDVVLFGMGGSSLAPEVLRKTFGADRFHVLDTTHPRAIRRLQEQLDLRRTCFVASSKSGTTLETRSHLEYFWEKSGNNARPFAAVPIPARTLSTSPASGASAPFSPASPRSAAVTPPLPVRHRPCGPDGHRSRNGSSNAPARCARRAGPRATPIRLRARPRVRRRLARGPRQDLHRGRRPGEFGLWAEQLIAESTGNGEGAHPRAGRVARWCRPPAGDARAPRSPSRSARSSSAGSSPSPSPAPTSRSTRSTSPTCRRRRTRRTRCSRPERSPTSSRSARSRSYSRRRKRATTSASTPSSTRHDEPRPARRAPATRERPRRHARLRAALPPLDRTTPQGRPEHRPLPPDRRRPGRRAADPRQALRLPALHPLAGVRRPRVPRRSAAAGSRASAPRRSVVQLGMVGLGRMGANMTERLRRPVTTSRPSTRTSSRRRRRSRSSSSSSTRRARSG